jgi:hypothetical protein
MSFRTLLLLVSTGALLGAAPATAQVAPQPDRAAPDAVTPAQRDGLLAAIEAAIRADYVFPEKRAAMIDRLEQARRDGRYATSDAGVLAQRLSEDLGASSGDHHVYLNYDPKRYAMAMHAPAPGDGAADSYDRSQSARDNSGLVEMRILGGNVRYLKIARFGWIADETGAAYDDAMRFLRGGDAVIIDLRANPGGDSAAVRYLVSHFLDPDTLEYSFLEGSKPPVQMRTLDYLPAGRMKGKPLFVLIDGGVASAAESFAYDVRQFRLGELVGARTLGGANNNKFVPIAPGFMLSISYGRPVHAVSGANWEGSGVEPSVATNPADALARAQDLALQHLKEQKDASPEAIAEYDWALVEVQSRLHPVALAPARLQALAGRYGDIEIKLEGGVLWMVRANRPPRRLVPLTEDGLFGVEGVDMLRLRITAGVLDTYWKGERTPRSIPRVPG